MLIWGFRMEAVYLVIITSLATVTCGSVVREPVGLRISEDGPGLVWRKGRDRGLTPAPSVSVGRKKHRKRGQVLPRTEVLPDIHYLADRVEKEGDDAHLYCKVDNTKGKIHMSWKKEGDAKALLDGKQPFDGRITVQKERHGVIELTITDLKPSDTANYTCMVKLESGRIVQKTKLLLIEYKSRFSRQEVVMKYHSLGGSTALSCQADGYPVPSYRWYKDGHQLSDNSTYTIGMSGKKTTLKIVTTTTNGGRWIFGTYSCKATNRYGSSVLQYSLQAAAIPEKSKNITIMKTKSTYVELGVAAPGDTGGIPITGYRVRWMEETKEASVEGGAGGAGAAGAGVGGAGVGQSHFVSSHVFAPGEPIVIPGLDPGKEYVFEIAAMNEAGVGKTVFKTIKTPTAEEDAAAVLLSSGSIGLGPLWIFLAILILFILLILLVLLLWCCGWIAGSALICCPCCAGYCPDCVDCCSALCWCLPLFGCCVCCGRTHKGKSYDVVRKKKRPMCICCPTEGVTVARIKDNIRLLALERDQKADIITGNSALSNSTKLGAGGMAMHAVDGYARNSYLQNDSTFKLKTDTMTSRRSDTAKNMVFSYDSDSSSSKSEHAMNTMQTQTGKHHSSSRQISRDHHVIRDVYLEDKRADGYQHADRNDGVQTYSLANDWSRTRSTDRLHGRTYRDDNEGELTFRRIIKRDDRYSSQPMGEHLSRRDSFNRDKKRRSSVEVITVYQPGEHAPATRDAKIQIYTNEDDFGSLPRTKLSKMYQDTRTEIDRHQRSSSIPRNIKLSTMVDMGDPTASNYGDQYSEVRKRRDVVNYSTVPVLRRPHRHTTDEGTQTFRRSKYEDELDIPLEHVSPAKEPRLQHPPGNRPRDSPTVQVETLPKTRHGRPQQHIQEIIYKPVIIETKETKTVQDDVEMKPSHKRWSRPPTPPTIAPSGTTYRAFQIDMDEANSRNVGTSPRPPRKPHRIIEIDETVRRMVQPHVHKPNQFDFPRDENSIQTQTDFSPLDSDSVTKESRPRWPQESPTFHEPLERPEVIRPQESAPVEARAIPIQERPAHRLHQSPVKERRPQWPAESPTFHEPLERPEVIRPQQSAPVEARAIPIQERPVHRLHQSPVKEGRPRWPEESPTFHEPLDRQEMIRPQESAPVEVRNIPIQERPVHVLHPTYDQGVVEETVIRRQRSIEFLDHMGRTETVPQYMERPDIVFVDSGNYSMETEGANLHHTSSRSETEPEHHLEVSPPETTDYYEQTEVIETKEVREEQVTEQTTETQSNMMEVQMTQAALHDFTRDLTAGSRPSSSDEGLLKNLKRAIESGKLKSHHGGATSKESTSQGSTSFGGGSASFGGGSSYSYQESSRLLGPRPYGTGSYSYQAQSEGLRSSGSEGRTLLAIERGENRSSPSYEGRSTGRSYWRV